MLAVAGLNSFYGRAHILHDVAFAMDAGEAVAVLGRNGAGKSTLLKSLIGLVRPASGRIEFAGHDVTAMAAFGRARLGMGYVPEERRIFAGLSVLENLDVGRQPAQDGVQPWTPARLFDLFPSLGALRHRLGGRMSGGEQQMLTVARTLMGNPRLLLLDEPGEGLAPLVLERMAVALLAVQAEGTGLLLTAQSLPFAARIATRALVLEGGRMAWSGSLATLAADSMVRQRLLGI